MRSESTISRSVLLAGITCKGTLTNKTQAPLPALILRDLFMCWVSEVLMCWKLRQCILNVGVKDGCCFRGGRLPLYHLLTLQYTLAVVLSFQWLNRQGNRRKRSCTQCVLYLIPHTVQIGLWYEMVDGKKKNSQREYKLIMKEVNGKWRWQPISSLAIFEFCVSIAIGQHQ